MTYVHDTSAPNEAEMWIMDAKTMSEKPLARIATPERIPYGFHCKWVTEEELASQEGF
jgi:carotenoid cleavage dioxygenase-like enzyme